MFHFKFNDNVFFFLLQKPLKSISKFFDQSEWLEVNAEIILMVDNKKLDVVSFE